MFHLGAYTELIDNTANTDVDALSDDVFAITNVHFLMPRDLLMFLAYAASATLTRARWSTPSINNISPIFIRPINVGALPTDDPNLADYRYNPVRLRAQEELKLEATSGVAMGTERFTGLFWLGDSITQAPPGDVYTLRATATTAAVANSWTTISLTWDNQLPAGSYAVIGGEYQATNALAFRCIFDDQWMRPGALGLTALGRRTAKPFYDGGMGLWGRFRTISLPRVQVLNNSTDGAHTLYLQCVRTGP